VLLGAAEPVSDEAVVDSLIGDILPGGCLRQYLEHACVAAILGNTIFVHGALDRSAIRRVPTDATRFFNPPVAQPMVAVDEVHGWVDAMNAVMQRGLAAHAAQPDWDPHRATRGGEVVMALQNRCAMWGRTVVSSAYADGGTITSQLAPTMRASVTKKLANGAHGSSMGALAYEEWVSDPRDAEVAQWLLSGGIRRIVVGHKPSGDSPAVLSNLYTGVEVVSADTSYADMNGAQLGRGVSMAGVTLSGPSLEENACRVFGTLADGRSHSAVLASLSSSGRAFDKPGDRHVGVELADGWWVKACISDVDDQPAYWCCRGAGREVAYKILTAAQLDAQTPTSAL